MNNKKLRIILLTVFTFFSLIIPTLAQEKNDKKFRIIYDDVENRTTVILNGIKLPKNKESFSVGASFEFVGKKLEKMPCCAVLFFTSFSEKQFKYKENHNLKITADAEVFDFGEINWQESYYGYVFIISGMSYPEEIFVAMETEKFSKIVKAKKIKAQLGNFNFKFSNQQLKALRSLEKFLRSNIGKTINPSA